MQEYLHLNVCPYTAYCTFICVWFVLISMVLTIAWFFTMHSDFNCDVCCRMKVTNNRLVWVHQHAVECVPLRASTPTPSA